MDSRALPDAEGPTPLALRLRAAADALVAEGRSARRWPAATRAAVLADVDHAVAVLATVRADLLVAQRDSGAWQGRGDASFEAWRARTSRGGMRAAAVEVRRADALATMPAVRDAAVAGQVTVEHVDVVAKAAASASAPVRAALGSEQGQATLVELARRVDAGQFARSVAQLAAGLDAEAHERSHQAQRAARFLHLADIDGGTRISGQLDRMAGHRLRLALEAVSGRPGADDVRTSEQRRADALDALAEKALSSPDTGSGAAVRPHISFVMTEQTWAGLRAARRGAPVPADAPDGIAAGAPPVTLEDGTPVPLSEVARALCDCELTRVVMGAGSEPLDLGRTQRTYTGAQRRAVIARDRGCAWPSCDRPARWCEVHHIKWWDRDCGATSVTNGALLCSFHHHEVHRQDLTIIRRGRSGSGEVAYTFTRPDGRVLATGPGDAEQRARPGADRPPDLRPLRPGGSDRPPDVRRRGERCASDRGAGDRGADERGVRERGVSERGVSERGVSERGVSERGVSERYAPRTLLLDRPAVDP